MAKGYWLHVLQTTLATVIALGLIFACFTLKTLIFGLLTVIFLFILTSLSNWLKRIYAGRIAAIRTKWIMMVLFSFGSFALWSGSGALLTAYPVGMVLAEFSSSDAQWLKRIRTLTTGFLTPFYFIRAGTCQPHLASCSSCHLPNSSR